MSVFKRGADGFEHTEANRREVLLAAGGVAAATALAGHTMDKKRPVAAKSTVVVDDPTFTPMELVAWSWGVSNSGSATAGGPGGAGAGKANFQDVLVSTRSGENSPRWLLAAASGKHLKKVTVTAVDVKGGHTTTLVLEQVLVTSFLNGGSIGDGPDVDNITLNFAKVSFSIGTATAVIDIAKGV